MLKIRMQRVGRKHEPVFRLVLTDSRNSTKSGRFLEILGSYDSRRAEKAEFKADQVLHWVKNGAQLSPTVHNLLVTRGVISGKKISVLPVQIIKEAKNKKMSDDANNVNNEEVVKKEEEGAEVAPVVEVPAVEGGEVAEEAAPAEEVAE